MAKTTVSSKAEMLAQPVGLLRRQRGDKAPFEAAPAARLRLEELLGAISALVEQFNSEFAAVAAEAGTGFTIGEEQLARPETPALCHRTQGWETAGGG